MVDQSKRELKPMRVEGGMNQEVLKDWGLYEKSIYEFDKDNLENIPFNLCDKKCRG